MDGREGMAMPGSAAYYLHRGFSGSGSGSVSGSHSHPGLYDPSGFRPLSNPHSSVQANVRDSSIGSAFPVEHPSPNFSRSLQIGIGDPGKKKRGRPRKYGPGGTNMALGLSPMSSHGSGSMTQTPKRIRGRPRGSGRKQQLAPLGEWMNSSAGMAFTPHIINVAVGEDVSAKIHSFSQQRPRAVCVMSANGAVSAVTLCQPTSSAGTVTYEGRFQILCLSGSYLVAESGGPHNRAGGLSVSLCTPDGHVIGGAVGGRLIASSPVQVVVCSFVYGGKTKNKTEADTEASEEKPKLQTGEKSTIQASESHSQNLTPNSSMSMWPFSRSDIRNPHPEIDLTRG